MVKHDYALFCGKAVIGIESICLRISFIWFMGLNKKVK